MTGSGRGVQERDMGAKTDSQQDGRTGKQLVADVESSVTAVRSAAGFLAGSSHSVIGGAPSSSALADAVTSTPEKVRKKVFELAGRIEALRQKKVSEVDVDAIDRWVVGEYSPERTGHQTYPAVLIGAVSGAAFFLAAALGIPYLPQTTLVAVNDGDTDPDDPHAAKQRWAPAAAEIARNNPRVSVYHMHDPAQDRPMMKQAAFFRLKRASLGPVYEEFLRHRLDPGGAIITLENTRTWRVTRTGERSFFQFGCLGGLPEEEYVAGSERVADFLQAEGSEHRRWDAPEPTERAPDGEWGFDPALNQDVQGFAAEGGWRRRRLYQNEPQDASAFIAELYRDWYRRLGWEDNRLLAQTYTLLDPAATLATGSVPFWNRFHMRPSYQVLAEYLDSAPAYEEILVSLFSHGVQSPGVAEVPEWKELARRYATGRGDVIGVDSRTFPLDAGNPLRYQDALQKAGPHRGLPKPLTLEEVDAFADRYGILSQGVSLPDHHDDVAGDGVRNPITWVSEDPMPGGADTNVPRL